MGRGVTRVTQALAVALVLGAATAQAQPWSINVQDRWTPEGSLGTWGLAVQVALPGPPSDADVTVNWQLIAGSATYPEDFVNPLLTGTLTFRQNMDQFLYINVEVNGDTIDEWTLPLTFHQDQVLFIQLSNPSANAFIQKGRATVRLVDDDHPTPGLQFLSAVNGVAAQNTLQWRVPAPQPTDIRVRWNQGVGCASPANTGVGVNGGDFLLSSIPIAVAGPGQLQTFPHSGRPAAPHCYSLFAMYGGTPTPEPMTVQATPFDGLPGPLKWTYSPGCYLPCAAATLAPPTVGFDAVYSVDNYGVLHAMQRVGPAGGAWPSTWQPLSLGKPTQSRSAVVPMRAAPFGDWRLFVGTDGGGVHAVDGKSGQLVWSRSAAFTNALLNDGGVQAAPAGLFSSFGGSSDMILVGTNNTSNSVYALSPATGDNLGTPFSDPQLGRIEGMAVVDYTANRAFFLTSDSVGVLFGIDLGPPLALASLPGGTNPLDCSSGSNGSAVLRNNRLFFGASSQVCMVDLLDGSVHQTSTGDGSVKGFLWPDRRNGNLYFSATTAVHAVREGTPPTEDVWASPLLLTGPSMVLQKPGTDYLYVGDGNGRLVQINAGSGLPISAPLVLDAGFQIGAPSLDNVNDLVVVGSDSGRIYAVRVPF